MKRGHNADAPQAPFLIDALDGGSAIQFAQERFCRFRRIAHWRTNADRFEASEVSAAGERSEIRLEA